MKYENYFKQPMQLVELKLNLIISEKPHLKISLDGSVNHLLIRIYSNRP